MSGEEVVPAPEASPSSSSGLLRRLWLSRKADSPTPQPDPPVLLLHGTLHGTIFEAKNLPELDRISGKLSHSVSALRGVAGVVERAENVFGVASESSRPYATLDVGPVRLMSTKVINQSIYPKWNQEFHIQTAHRSSHLIITVKHNDQIGAAVVGQAKFLASALAEEEVLEGWFPLLHMSGKALLGEPAIRVALRFVPVVANPHYSLGPGRLEAVPNVFFPLRQGCHLTLYQDAHVPPGSLPAICMEGGALFQQGGCWEAIYSALEGAQHVIYLIAWSLFDKVHLLRPHHPAGAALPTVGELLKAKAEQGVAVLLQVWDDKTSVASLGLTLKKDGVMNTHDEETAAFFKGSKVKCLLSRRNPDAAQNLNEGFHTGTWYTHHQKNIIVDAPAPGSSGDSRQLVAFLGGLDLTHGRYDTPAHPLFSTLGPGCVHEGDFYQPSTGATGADGGGPRQPWHDVHARVAGPAVQDLLCNFEQRWAKQAPKKLMDSLPNLAAIQGLQPPPLPQDPVLQEQADPRAWRLQVFRSIDTGSVAGLPNAPEEAAAQGLSSRKYVTVDHSVLTAHVHAIRRAQRFIYMESQYFLGSAYAWEKSSSCGCNHTIPMEVALKTCAKIKANERFAVYILIPLNPEGPPASAAVQQILHFQHQTMAMMYRLIADTLKEVGRAGEHPRDFLNFFCLGNAEVAPASEPAPSKPPPPFSPHERAQRSRRFMVYVHSKLLIADDEYLLIGSANVNQRSMDGCRDTEIAIGGYQPFYTLAGGRRGALRGDIHGFRMSLWAEHTAALPPIYAYPETLPCIQELRRVGEQGWLQFAGSEVVDMAAHLMAYPLQVNLDGSVEPLPRFPFFPDTEARIVGTTSNLPDMLTT